MKSKSKLYKWNLIRGEVEPIVNLKEYIPQVYELRLIQSARALLSFSIKYKNHLSEDKRKEFLENKNILDRFFKKMVYDKKMLRKKEIDTVIGIYLYQLKNIKGLYKSLRESNKTRKYWIYLMGIHSISSYYQTELELYKYFGIKEDTTFIQDILNACLVCKNIIIELIRYEDMEKNSTTEKNEANNKLTDKDIETAIKSVEEFIFELIDEVLYPVKHEHNRQSHYIQAKNKKILGKLDVPNQ